MTRVTLRPTIPSDLAQIVPTQKLPFRIRALTVLEGERVLGVGGIGFQPDGAVVAFVEQSDDAKRFPVSFHRAGLAAMRMIRESGLPLVVATTDADYAAGRRWLTRLGFVEAAAEFQEIPGKRLFYWSREAECSTIDIRPQD